MQRPYLTVLAKVRHQPGLERAALPRQAMIAADCKAVDVYRPSTFGAYPWKVPSLIAKRVLQCSCVGTLLAAHDQVIAKPEETPNVKPLWSLSW